MYEIAIYRKKEPWNKNKLVGQKAPFRLQQIFAIRARLEMNKEVRNLALFNLAIDSKLRGCDLLSLKVRDVAHGASIQSRTMIVQKKTQQPVQFEITKDTRACLKALIDKFDLHSYDFLFPSRNRNSEHLTTRAYARIVKQWVVSIGLDPANYGTHSLRRTKPSLIYKQTKNLRACQLLLGHSKLESTVRYLGIEVDDALEISESIDC
ncbi:tyrosine-type recombinase/integrase [Glaciecola sp. KUL10]|uniref:tyrosine-type recombinase/integrase n=1 Tax=Glaciecola sp. (strain KUL10) TaxID=2161813 RepID=UPI000D786782|nr:tyrosine-type recombinase/integrase [Glaciecola sp. KUL10]